METLFLQLLNISISASYFFLAIFLLRLVFRRIPKRIYCILWGIAALRLILPFSLESIFSLIPSAETVPLDIMYQISPKINSGISFVNNSLNPIISESFAPDGFTSANPLQIWTFILSFVWLIGFVCMISYMITSYAVLRSKMKTSTFYGDNIWQSDKASSPFVLGLIKPRIYIPYSINEGDISYVLSHENAHIDRGDHIYKPLGFLLLSVYWFNPFLWIAYILLCRDIEMACDEKVISNYSIDEKRAYSSALLNCSIRQHKIAACPLAFGEVGIKERINGVMSYKKPAFWVIVLAVILSLVLGVCFLTNPKTDKPSLEDFKSKTYAVTNTVYENTNSADGNKSALSFVISEEGELGLINVDPEKYFLMSFAMMRPFPDSYLKETKLSKENFDILFEGRCFTNGTTAEELRKENATAWIASGMPTNRSFDTYILLCQNGGQLYMVSATDNKAAYVFAIKEAASLFDVNALSSVSINGADVLTEKSTIGWNSYYVGNADARNEFTQYVLDSKYIYYGSISPLPTVEFDTADELSRFLEKHNATIDCEATLELAHLGTTQPLNYLLENCDEQFFKHSKLVFVCIASHDGYSYEIDSFGISEEEFRMNVRYSGYHGNDKEFANWIIAVQISKDTPAAKVDRYEAVSHIYSGSKYVYENSNDYIKPYFIIDGNIFSFTLSGYSSYLASGKVEYGENTITLRSNDGNAYVFTNTNGNYVFDAKNSSQVPSFKESSSATPTPCIPDGAVFVFQQNPILALK